jgi:hypothetical protein
MTEESPLSGELLPDPSDAESLASQRPTYWLDRIPHESGPDDPVTENEHAALEVVFRAWTKNIRAREWMASQLGMPSSSASPPTAQELIQKCAEPVLPNARESLVIAPTSPKTAALAFDRVYWNPLMFGVEVPKELAFYYAAGAGLEFTVGSMIAASIDVTEYGYDTERTSLTTALRSRTGRPLQWLTSTFPRPATVLLGDDAALQNEFASGRHEVLHAAIVDVGLVEEGELSWEQVLEFRQDADSRIKYRRFVRWIDDELKSGSPDEVVELMQLRLDDYHWALRKHGIKTSIGALSCLLEPKFIGASTAAIVAAAATGGASWASFVAASLVLGRSGLEFGTRLVDSVDALRRDNYELAYLHDVSKHLK